MNKQPTILAFVAASVIAIVAFTGCVSTDPVYSDVPGPNGEQVQIGSTNYVSPELQETLDKILLAHDGTASLNPYAPLTRPVIAGVGALLVAISSLIAGVKNRQASNASTALETIVQAVESTAPEVSDAVKASVKSTAAVKGTTTLVKTAVTAAKQ
jgi:hypothetical protein